MQSDADLRARSQMTAGGRVAILSLKHGRDQVAIRIRVLAPDGRAPAARDVLASVLRYILETSRAEPATLRALLARQVGREAAEEIMTTAEMLRREGEARGEARGEVKGKRGTLLLQLRQRFGRLAAAAVARIDKAGAAELDVWASRVLTASSLDEVLGAKVTVPPNEIAFSRRRRDARGASGTTTDVKTLVERTRPSTTPPSGDPVASNGTERRAWRDGCSSEERDFTPAVRPASTPPPTPRPGACFGPRRQYSRRSGAKAVGPRRTLVT